MNAKLNKCSDNEIYHLLMSDIESKIPVIKLHRIAINDHLVEPNKNKNINYFESDELFDSNKSMSKNSSTRKSTTSLKIKLRRSTEQSNYKIDNRSNKKITKNIKENNDPVESPRRIERRRSRPKRFSDYECDIAPDFDSLRLRTRRTINCNEDLTNHNSSSEHNKHEDSDFKGRLIKQKQLSEVLNDTEESIQIVDDNQLQNITDTPKKATKRIARTKFTIDIMDEDLNNTDNTLLLTKKHRQTAKNKLLDEQNRDNDEEEINDLCDGIKMMSNNVLTPKKKNNRQEQKESKDLKNIRTPKASVSFKLNNLTPSMEKRTSLLTKPLTPLQQSRSKLHVSVIPKSLPCREEEFNNIFTFLEGKLKDKCGGCIYISGVPGTGKTATVNEVIRCLKRSVAKGKLDDFNFFEINGMKLTEPRQAYVQIWKQMNNGNTCTWEKAYHELEKRFTSKNSKRLMTLLLVDELDLLCTKRQDVVYNLLDWPTKANAQLVVITIANTMDLPERVLMGRVTSRLGLTRLTFQPYNHKQLQEIVLTRLKDSDAFRSEAIQLVARKVSAVSGDARRALDICRRATEIAELHEREKVTMQDVNEALSEMIESSKVQAIKHCSKMEQMFLQSISALVTRTSIEEACFKDVYHQLCSVCSFEGIRIPNITEVFAICGRLEASRLIIRDNARMDIHQRILLNASADDIHFALQPINLN
ncbi:PREDICTED: origin recognition complex subunit 1 [Polistes dominula]|uniref:Origin recognition complex subunit 1 n=1 Tax=Polistes dominula TaxID=743375 RepID=A0ABM1J4U9_POLDO|nr:PREDICTED: origin recognition complex subunit 1 [Polistes dominula]